MTGTESNNFQTASSLNPPKLPKVSIQATVLASRMLDGFEHILVGDSNNSTDPTDQAVIEIANKTDTRRFSAGDSIKVTDGILLGERDGQKPTIEAFHSHCRVRINE